MSARASLRSAAEFGYRVREARERQGITQAALAERVNVSIRWLSNFERGKSPRAELFNVVHVARAAVTGSREENQCRAKAALSDPGDTTQRVAEATSSGEPVGPSAMQVMQSMLENTGRRAAEAQPTTGPEEGDRNGEA